MPDHATAVPSKPVPVMAWPILPDGSIGSPQVVLMPRSMHDRIQGIAAEARKESTMRGFSSDEIRQWLEREQDSVLVEGRNDG